MIEAFVWGLQGDPTAGPVRHHVIADFWYAVFVGPPSLWLFFDIDEDSRKITLDFITLPL